MKSTCLRRAGVSFMPEMIASHFLPSSAGMMPSNPVFWKLAFTPICAASASPISMSDPTGVVPL